jgi:hypothetical protein
MWHLRAAILTVVGALALHQGRYLLAPPEHVHSGAHAYFAWAIPLIAVLALAAVAELGLRLARARGETAPKLPPTSILFVVFTFTLLTIFGAQETIEALLVDGAIPTENPFVADGAWTSIPLALAIGALLALLLRGVAFVVALVGSRPQPRRPRRSLARPLARIFPIARSGLSRSLAPRGPPLLS